MIPTIAIYDRYDQPAKVERLLGLPVPTIVRE